MAPVATGDGYNNWFLLTADDTMGTHVMNWQASISGNLPSIAAVDVARLDTNVASYARLNVAGGKNAFGIYNLLQMFAGRATMASRSSARPLAVSCSIST